MPDVTFTGSRVAVLYLDPQLRAARRVDKHPDETFVIAWRYQDGVHLPSGVTVSSASASALRLSDDSAAPSVIGSESVSGGVEMRVPVQAGTDGEDYLVTAEATLSDTTVLVEQVLLRVRISTVE